MSRKINENYSYINFVLQYLQSLYTIYVYINLFTHKNLKKKNVKVSINKLMIIYFLINYRYHSINTSHITRNLNT